MYQNPLQANYGRANYGQMAPYRDVAAPDDEDERPRTPPALAQAIAPPQQSQQAPVDTGVQSRARLQQGGPSGSGAQGGMSSADGSLASLGGGGGVARVPGNVRPGRLPSGTSAGGWTPPSRGTGYDGSGITGGMQFPRRLDQSPWAGHPGEGAPDPTVPNAGLPDFGEFEGVRATFLDPAQLSQPQQLSGSMTAAARPAGDPSWFTGGWNQDKLDANHRSPKYDVRRALQAGGFDPRQGITPEVEAVLDGLGYGDGTVTGQDTYRFNSNDPAFNGMFEFDLVRGFDTGNGQWNFEPVNGGGAQGAPGGFQDPMMAALGGANPEEEQYAQALGVDTSNPLWRQILEQLQAESLGGAPGAY
jgi:hypothetical protein